MNHLLKYSWLLFLTTNLYSQAGSIDTTFKQTGTQINGIVTHIVSQNDGKVIAAGNFTSYNQINSFGILRLNNDGSLDPSFVTGTGVGSGNGGFINSLVLQNDGKILIGGQFSSFNNVQKGQLIRLNQDGNLDTSFSLPNNTFNSVMAIALLSNGHIIAAGHPNSLKRITNNGNIDPSFNTGLGPNGPILDIAIQNNGQIIIAGEFVSYDGVQRQKIARINTDGSLDGTFNANLGALVKINSIEILKNGKILIAGESNTQTGTGLLLRLNSNGETDTTFNQYGAGPNSAVRTIAVQQDEKIVIGGDFTQYNAETNLFLARLNSNGKIDSSFVSLATYFTTIHSIAIQEDNKILISGNFPSYSGYPIQNLARLNSMCCSTLLNLKLFIEGLYIGNGLMQPLLYNNGISMDTSIVDTISLYLYKPDDLNQPYRNFKTMLKTNGQAIFNLNEIIINREYYLVIRYKNSISTWSKVPVLLNSYATYDF